MATSVIIRERCLCSFAALHNQAQKVFFLSYRHESTSASIEPAKQYPTVSTLPTNLKRGTGGRSSFSGKVATVFGASGFLGRAVVNQLGKMGTQVIVPYRATEHFVRRLRLCGDLGQILFQHFSLKDEESLYRAMKYSNVVINLIGRDHETKNFPFDEVHVNGPQKIARIAKECGVETLIHVSAMNVSENPQPVMLKKGSGFLRSKWHGENAVREEFPEAIIFRPSDMHGEGDKFTWYYAGKQRHSYIFLPLWNKGAGVIKQPVFVSDVARGIVKAMFDPLAVGKTYQAIGPNRYELSELVEWFRRVTVPFPLKNYRIDLRYDFYMWLKVMISENFRTRHRLLSWERLERDHITDDFNPELPTLEDLGVALTPLEERIFIELMLFRQHGYQDPLMQEYIRPVKPAPLVDI